MKLAVAATRACPRCKAPLTSVPDEQGSLCCSQCGARFRVRAATPVQDPVVAMPSAAVGPANEALLDEVRALRAQQDQILANLALIFDLLKSGGSAAASDPAWHGERHSHESSADAVAPATPPRMRRRQKTALLIDDDPTARDAAVTALRDAQIPVRASSDGNDALAAIASEKPDVIVLELDVAGAMSGRDIVNMIKATMEWVDIPILLYTRSAISSLKEAREIHGGDAYVAKGPGSTEALVARVISIFKSGQ